VADGLNLHFFSFASLEIRVDEFALILRQAQNRVRFADRRATQGFNDPIRSTLQHLTVPKRLPRCQNPAVITNQGFQQ